MRLPVTRKLGTDDAQTHRDGALTVEIDLSEVKDDLSRFLRLAATEQIVITRHGKPAGVLIGFQSEDDWFDYRLEHDPRFRKRIEASRRSLREGEGTRREEIKGE
jgi:prevent-host-death family protein